MKTYIGTDETLFSDAHLVQLSLAGERDAFGQLVTRYQSPICALAYSACGNVAQSEDVAQEIFLTAWRKLNTLQDPNKFKAWLYGIARNILRGHFRDQSRNAVFSAEPLEDIAEPQASASEPDEQIISKEEQSILWHILSGLPQLYREPMVLFYREHESTERVAEALQLSEDAVRQRLARGRALLNERVAKVIQIGLRRTGPADTFAAGVVTALTTLTTATTAKGTVLGVAATSSTGKVTGLAGFLKGFAVIATITAIPAALGSWLGFKLSQDATGLPHRKRAVSRFWTILSIGLSAFALLPLLLTVLFARFLPGEHRAGFLSVMTGWLFLAYPLALCAVGFWVWHRRRGAAFTNVELTEAPASTSPKAASRPVLWVTLASAGLLVFCLCDMNSVANVPSAELQQIISDAGAKELRVSILKSHYRSLFRTYPQTYEALYVELLRNGKTAKYSAPSTEPLLALLKTKGIPCPAYVEGRDFAVLGAPGRLLPLLTAFVLALGLFFLLKSRKPSSNF